MARDPVREAALYAWSTVAAGALALLLAAGLWFAPPSVWRAIAPPEAPLSPLVLPVLAAFAGLACWGSWGCVPSAGDRLPSRAVVTAGVLLSGSGLVGAFMLAGAAATT